MGAIMKKIKILVVEDEAMMASSIKKMLQRLNYEVIATCSTGEEAIEQAQTHSPDLILMDIMLAGDMDGIETADWIRSHCGLPVIYLTAYADDEIIKRAKTTHPFGYLIKPVQPRELKIVIEMALYRIQIEGELALSKANFHSIVQKNNDGILLVDGNGKIVFTNPAACTLFGRCEKNLYHQPFGLPVGQAISEIEIVRSDGSAGTGEMRIIETEWRQQPAHLIMISDITLRKQAEMDLKAAMDMRSEFISMVSHELRTPLTAIKQGIGLLLEGIAGDINPEQQEVLEITQSNVDRLSRLINDVLDFSKLESGKMKLNLQPCSINQIIQDAHSTLNPTAQERNITLTTDLTPDLPEIHADKDKITQVMINLLGNALKYSENGQVILKTELSKHAVRVSVKDSGPGIKAEDLARVFKKFEQLENGGQRKTGGSGLGLAIAKELIEKHRGVIWVESIYGQGATFSFTLPQRSHEDLIVEYLEERLREASHQDSKISLALMTLQVTARPGHPQLSPSQLENIWQHIKILLNNNLRHSQSGSKRPPDAVYDLCNEFFMVLANCGSDNCLKVRNRLEPPLKAYLKESHLDDVATWTWEVATYPDESLTAAELINVVRKKTPQRTSAEVLAT